MTEAEKLTVILEEIRDALIDVAKTQKCKDSECCLRYHPSGVLTIDVKGVPVPGLYFFNEEDLFAWIAAKDESRIKFTPTRKGR